MNDDAPRAPGVRELTKRERKALAYLADCTSEHGYAVNHRMDVTTKSYLFFRSAGLIDEVWTWASTTRPGVRVSAIGRKALGGTRS